MKKLFLSIALLSFAGLVCMDEKKGVIAPVPHAVAEAGTKIGYVRMDRIVNMEKLDEVAHEWRDRVKELQADLEGRQNKIMTEKQKFEKEASEFSDPNKSKWMDDAAREAKQEILVKKRDELQTSMNYLREYEGKMSRKLQADMFAKIEKTANALGKKQGYDLVLAGGALYASKRVDITDDVLSTLNKEYDAEKAAEKAKQAKALAPAKK